jgi:aspartate/methionine/tyrosine aminotransferase
MRNIARFAPNEIISLVEYKPEYELGESYGPSLSVSELLAEGSDGKFGDVLLEYGTPEGSAALRRAIAERHGAAPDDVVVTVGGAHALFVCSFILCERGDEALLASPVFPPTRASLDAVGAKVNVLQLGFSNAYRPDLAEFRALLSQRTRLVSIASPQNPSGVGFPQNVLREMLATMSRVCPDAYLLVDETYREATYGASPVAETACVLSPKVISIASLSKCHGAAGLRIGWAITRDEALRKQLVLGKFNSIISCSAVDEALALRVLEQSDSVMAQRRANLGDALRRTAAWVYRNERYVDWVRPEAGAMCCVRLKKAAFDDAAVARFYDELESAGTRVANGMWFGDEARVFRLGFGLLSPDTLEHALAAVTSALERASRVTV